MTARRNIYIDNDINEQIEKLVESSGGRHGEIRYVFNSLLRESPRMKKLLKSVDTLPAAKASVPAVVKEISIAEQIFNYWREVMEKPTSAKLTDKRSKTIKARLADGYTAEQIGHAIQGCKLSAWHMGDNDKGKPYNDIELICRNGEKLEGFIEQLSRGEQNGGHGQVQGNAQGGYRSGQQDRQPTPLQRTIADYDEGMAYARTLRANLETPVIDGQEVRGALE